MSSLNWIISRIPVIVLYLLISDNCSHTEITNTFTLFKHAPSPLMTLRSEMHVPESRSSRLVAECYPILPSGEQLRESLSRLKKMRKKIQRNIRRKLSWKLRHKIAFGNFPIVNQSLEQRETLEEDQSFGKFYPLARGQPVPEETPSWVTRLQYVAADDEEKSVLSRISTFGKQHVLPEFIDESKLPRSISPKGVTKFLMKYVEEYGYKRLSERDRKDLVEIPRKSHVLNEGKLTDDEDRRRIARIQQMDEEMSEAIKTIQHSLGIRVTGNLDNETLETMVMPRCAMKDIEPAMDGTDMIGGGNFVLRGAWNKYDLTYRIQNYTDKHAKCIGYRSIFQANNIYRLNPKEFDQALAKAMKYWEDVTPITFTRLSSNSTTADIDVYFAEGSHGDKYKFDGMGGVLAHAFYPPYGGDDSKHGIPGDMHFDITEKFAVKGGPGIDILQTSLHELGHSLGLMHSRNKRAVMAPVYRRYDPNLKLHQDDIEGIQLLYGPPEPSLDETTTAEKTSAEYATYETTAPETTTVKSFSYKTTTIVAQTTVIRETKNTSQSTTSDWDHSTHLMTSKEIQLVYNCDKMPFDAFTEIRDGSTYAFRGSVVWKVGKSGLEEIGARYIQEIWKGAPSNIDAAFTRQSDDPKNRLTYFLKGSKVWIYSNTIPHDTNPKYIANLYPGIPNSIDAAFALPKHGLRHPEKIAFIKGCKVYYYSFPSEPNSESPRVKTFNLCEQLPESIYPIQAALTYNRRIYLFSNDTYARVTDVDRRLKLYENIPKYPRSIDHYWMGCPIDD